MPVVINNRTRNGQTQATSREYLIRWCKARGLKLRKASRWTGKVGIDVCDSQGNKVAELRGTKKVAYLLHIAA